MRPPERSWLRDSYAGLVWATAVGFLLAFGLTWLVRQPLGEQFAGEGTQTHASSQMLAAADPARESTDSSAQAPSEQPDAADRWELVTLVMDDGSAGGEQRLELPVVESGDGDRAWLDEEAPVVPQELRVALERLGHRVDERRQLLPFTLEDGRQGHRAGGRSGVHAAQPKLSIVE